MFLKSMFRKIGGLYYIKDEVMFIFVMEILNSFGYFFYNDFVNNLVLF